MHLKRPRYSMPDFIRAALGERDLMVTHHARPPYQKNDYIGWITRAKRKETKKNVLIRCWMNLNKATFI